jgi:glycosyltransferase involved in cell wall biosynthesis
MPRATILTTVFNCEDYIAIAVGSALAQTEPDIEVLVVDDGCTDGTIERLGRFDDPRLRILPCGRQGRARALNIGLAAASAEYVAILDADDIALPDRVQLQADFLDANHEIVLVGSRFRPSIDATGHPIQREVFPTEVEGMIESFRRFICPLFHSSVMYRKAAAAAVGGYDEAILCVEDVDLYVKLIGPARRPVLTNLDAELSLKRVHPEQFHYGSKVGVWQSPHGLRSRETVKGRIAEAFGDPPAFGGGAPT